MKRAGKWIVSALLFVTLPIWALPAALIGMTWEVFKEMHLHIWSGDEDH
jgi:hypothetical protein